MFWKQATHLPGFIINQSLLDKFRQTKKHQCPKLWTVLPLSSLCVRGRQQNSFFYWKFMDANSRVALAQCYSYSVLLSLGLWWSYAAGRDCGLCLQKKNLVMDQHSSSHMQVRSYTLCVTFLCSLHTQLSWWFLWNISYHTTHLLKTLQCPFSIPFNCQ